MTNKTKRGGVRLGSALQFLKGFIREPLTVGALWPSSDTLSRVVADSCDFEPADTVVELGPGTGSFTKLLLERLDHRGQLLALEINEASIRALRKGFPRCRGIHDSAEHLGRHLGGRKAQCVISGLAWGNMLPAAQDRIMNAITGSLAPDGQFVAFAYIHARYYPTTLRFRKLMFRGFARVETTPVIWRNLPPAYVYRCWQPKVCDRTEPVPCLSAARDEDQLTGVMSSRR
jgi:phosphatidylethanolamine/phosphatidyl-N-methylethanolamine N-methyltransferase